MGLTLQICCFDNVVEILPGGGRLEEEGGLPKPEGRIGGPPRELLGAGDPMGDAAMDVVGDSSYQTSHSFVRQKKQEQEIQGLATQAQSNIVTEHHWLKRYSVRLQIIIGTQHEEHLRTICGFSLSDRKTNDSILKLCKLPTIAGEVRFRRLRWLGHVSRMSDDRLPKKLLFGQMLGTGVRGRPMDSWNKIVCSDLLKLGAAYSWYRTGFDRTAWRQLVAPVRT